MYVQFPRSNYNPYLEDTYPVPSGSGEFGKNNSGGRWLRPNSSINIPDQVGKEERPVQDDLCILTETAGGGVYFDTSSMLTKWYFAIRGKGYVEDIEEAFLAGNYTDFNGMYNAVALRWDWGDPALGRFINYSDSGSSIYQWDGSGNTLVAPTPNDITVPFDLFFYSDGINVYLYYNGIYRGYVTPGGFTGFDLTYLLRAYSIGAFGPYSSNGKFYDARLGDLCARNESEINAYMAINAELYHYDAMPKNDGWTKRILGLNEKTGTESVDTGDAAPINGVYYLTDPAVLVSNLHDITLFPEWIQNQHNKYGYKISGSRVIPNTPNGTNVLGTPDFFKSVKYNAEITGGLIGDFNQASSINTGIILGSNSFFIEIKLDNVILDATAGGVLGNQNAGAQPYFILRNLSSDDLTITIKDSIGTIVQTNYNVLVGNELLRIELDRDNDELTLYRDGVFEKTVAAVLTGDVSNGLTPIFIGSANVAGIYFLGNLSLFNYNDTLKLPINGNSYDTVNGVLKAWTGTEQYIDAGVATSAVLSHLKEKWYLLAGGEEVTQPQFVLPGGAIEYKPGYNHAFTFITDFDPSATRPSQAIGHKAHLLMNRLCYTGNAFNLPEYWDGDAPFITDTDLLNVSAWKDCSMDYILAHANAIAVRYIYQYLMNSRVKDIILYANQKTLGEQTILTDLGWEKTYI